MAFIATTNGLMRIRSAAWAPGNTGGGRPRPVPVDQQRPEIESPIRPTTVPERRSKPASMVLKPITASKPDYTPAAREPSGRSSGRSNRTLRYAGNDGRSRPSLDQLPVGQMERNISPSSGSPSKTAGFRRAGVTRTVVEEDNGA